MATQPKCGHRRPADSTRPFNPSDEKIDAPKGRRVRLAEIVKIIEGYPFTSADQIGDGTIYVIQRGDIEKGGIKRYLAGAHLPELKGKQLMHTGDIVVEYRLGMVNALSFVAGPVCITAAAPLVILRPRDRETIDSDYLAAFLQSQEGIGRISATVPPASLEGFDLDKLRKISFRLPRIEEQREIVQNTVN